MDTFEAIPDYVWCDCCAEMHTEYDLDDLSTSPYAECGPEHWKEIYVVEETTEAQGGATGAITAMRADVAAEDAAATRAWREFGLSYVPDWRDGKWPVLMDMPGT